MKIGNRRIYEADVGKAVIYIYIYIYIYMPKHANSDINHKDCERGVITSFNGVNVFVNYGKGPQATSPSDLRWLT